MRGAPSSKRAPRTRRSADRVARARTRSCVDAEVRRGRRTGCGGRAPAPPASARRWCPRRDRMRLRRIHHEGQGQGRLGHSVVLAGADAYLAGARGPPRLRELRRSVASGASATVRSRGADGAFQGPFDRPADPASGSSRSSSSLGGRRGARCSTSSLVADLPDLRSLEDYRPAADQRGPRPDGPPDRRVLRGAAPPRRPRRPAAPRGAGLHRRRGRDLLRALRASTTPRSCAPRGRTCGPAARSARARARSRSRS